MLTYSQTHIEIAFKAYASVATTILALFQLFYSLEITAQPPPKIWPSDSSLLSGLARGKSHN